MLSELTGSNEDLLIYLVAGPAVFAVFLIGVNLVLSWLTARCEQNSDEQSSLLNSEPPNAQIPASAGDRFQPTSPHTQAIEQPRNRIQ